jgi:hypothetical protein
MMERIMLLISLVVVGIAWRMRVPMKYSSPRFRFGQHDCTRRMDVEMLSQSHEEIQRSCMEWVTSFVIKHQLCPWAQGSLAHLQFEIFDTALEEKDDLITNLEDLANRLVEAHQRRTVLIAVPQYTKFDEFMKLVEEVEDMLYEIDLDEDIALARFHPEFRVLDDDGRQPIYDSVCASDFRHRSPYPLLHYILHSEMEEIVDEERSLNLFVDNTIKITELSKQLGGEEGLQKNLDRMKNAE